MASGDGRDQGASNEMIARPMEEPRALTQTYYDRLFSSQLSSGTSVAEAAKTAADAFLDGKPAVRASHKTTWTDRHAVFWSSTFLTELPADAWAAESMVLVLARYLGQDRYANRGMVERVAATAPEVLKRAVRYSGLVLRPHSPKWGEIKSLRHSQSESFGAFVRILEIFDQAHRERVSKVASLQEPLTALSPLELLAYASLYAFEHLVPVLSGQGRWLESRIDHDAPWQAINDILTWKLTSCDLDSLQLSDERIGLSLRQHLSPFLFPSRESPAREDLLLAFRQLMTAQVELNSFISQSAEAFSYNDDIEFVLNEGQLELIERNPSGREAWMWEEAKLNRLHGYWLYRGMDALIESKDLLARVGPDNLEANLQAFAKAMGTYLQLQDVYGIAECAQTQSGLTVDVFRSLLAMELMTAFFIEDFLHPYGEYLKQSGDVRTALGRLAFDGLLQGDMQNRFPVTWSDKAAKIERIKPWTVSSGFPQGHAKSAEAILDFWTNDWVALAVRLRNGQAGVEPELLERPMLKMGRYLFQLPWMIALQNNATATINNLRRIGSRRKEAREETQRIEQRLADEFERRGFRTLVNCHPPVQAQDDPGEIDLLCARDGHLLVMEVKSTYMRRSRKEAWLHGTTTLRKAGLQLHQKVLGLCRLLASDPHFSRSLGLDAAAGMPLIKGWIVDTSIECDHRLFCGFLKVSLEEVLIALRDDRRLLYDPEGLLGGRPDGHSRSTGTGTLYENGFSAARFVDVIEKELVWETGKRLHKLNESPRWVPGIPE